MVNAPTGYWNIYGAVSWAADIREKHHATTEGKMAGPFGGANIGKDAARVIQDALEGSELRAAGVRAADGVLVTIRPAAWRVSFTQRYDTQQDTGYGNRWTGGRYGPPPLNRILFVEAREGRTIPLLRHWVTPIIAQADLCRWADVVPLPAEPPERPDDWPVPAARSAADEQLEWFALGYAVRALEGGKPATRDELRDAVTRENLASARKAEAAHVNLQPRLKGADKSKGGTPKK